MSKSKSNENKPLRYKRERLCCILCWAVPTGLAIILGAILSFCSFRPFTTNVLLFVLLGLIILSAVSVFLTLRFILLPLFQSMSHLEDTYLGTSENETLRISDTIERLDDYLVSLKDKEVSAILLQKQAELDSLQSQINPHFLYNTLDSIRGQALEDGSVQSSEMIEALSTLLRYTISHRSDMVTLGQELKSVDNYIKIQQYRFNNRFEYRKNIEDYGEDLLSIKIPKLTLQPLIENAIYHGIDSLLTKGLIEMDIYCTQTRLIISVSDNGVGMDAEQLESIRNKLKAYVYDPKGSSSTKSTGVAISNVNSRIKLAFGDLYGVTIFSKKNVGSKFQISIPINNSNTREDDLYA